MRLAFEITTCTTQRTGIGYYAEHLADALLQTCAAEDHLALISNRPPAPELARRWAPHLLVQGAAARALWMQIDAPRLLSRWGADVAVFPNYIAPLVSPCPTVVVVHDVALMRLPELFTWRKRLMRPLVRRSIAAASVVATVSEASRRDIISCLGVEPGRLAVLPGAAHPACGHVSSEAIAAVRARYGRYLLTVGTLEPRKNLLTLLSAYRRLDSDLDLLVVGGRGWHDRELVRALDAHRVRWLGYVPEEELVALYAAAELFVYPSRLEGFGLPVVEAMACGAPVVTSDVPALREVAGDAATLVPPGDADALAAAMAGVLGDPRTAQAMRERGRVRAQAFSWTRTAESLWRIAREVGTIRERRERPVASLAGRLLGWGRRAHLHRRVAGAPPDTT